MTSFYDESYALYPSSGSGRGFDVTSGEQDGREWREVDGLVETPWGFVRAHSWYFEKAYKSSSLEMIKDGRCYWRRFDKEFTARGLVTKAKQFAAELNA